LNSIITFASIDAALNKSNKTWKIVRCGPSRFFLMLARLIDLFVLDLPLLVDAPSDDCFFLLRLDFADLVDVAAACDNSSLDGGGGGGDVGGRTNGDAAVTFSLASV